ncbi:hypothetical protein BDZ97DRAFT_1039555 [Flammula alnicola]|nr:hypothetical protein BDZ97DRAFT_1039555 [Flammula alnicola]
MSLFDTLPPLSIGHRGDPPTADDDLDAETSALIAKLALDDLEQVFTGRKGKARADAPLSDEEYAYQLQSEQFKEWLSIAEDAKYARSLGVALTTDAAYLDALITAEEAAAQDRRVAEMVSRGEELPPPTAAQTRVEHPAFVMHPDPPSLSTTASNGFPLSEKQPKKVEVSADDDSESLLSDFDHEQNASLFSSIKPLASHIFAPGPSINRNKLVNCTICKDSLRYHEALHTPCDHCYCSDCVVTLVNLFTRDESLFPLRCCQQPIPITDVVPFVSSTLRKLFEAKHAEFSVLSKDRIYCVSPTCSTFLGSSEGVVGTGVVCPACQRSTCPRCKQAEHVEEDCVVNAATVELRALARREAWQTCPGCHTLVELYVGCYHMTCRCRTQFCYLCAARWKSCQCPQWEENRLLATAQQRVENELGPQAVRRAAPAVLARQVQERVQSLRVNHDCNQHSWTYRRGGGRCEECHYNLPDYLLICRHCSLLACVRCSRNRL